MQNHRRENFFFFFKEEHGVPEHIQFNVASASCKTSEVKHLCVSKMNLFLDQVFIRSFEPTRLAYYAQTLKTAELSFLKREK